jgi:hypothetical protein
LPLAIVYLKFFVKEVEIKKEIEDRSVPGTERSSVTKKLRSVFLDPLLEMKSVFTKKRTNMMKILVEIIHKLLWL